MVAGRERDSVMSACTEADNFEDCRQLETYDQISGAPVDQRAGVHTPGEPIEVGLIGRRPGQPAPVGERPHLAGSEEGVAEWPEISPAGKVQSNAVPSMNPKESSLGKNASWPVLPRRNFGLPRGIAGVAAPTAGGKPSERADAAANANAYRLLMMPPSGRWDGASPFPPYISIPPHADQLAGRRCRE